MSKFNIDDVVDVRWTDACSYPNWRSLDEAQQLTGAPIRTIGFLVCQNKERITICHSRGSADGDTDHNGFIVIPAGWVQSMKKIKA